MGHVGPGRMTGPPVPRSRCTGYGPPGRRVAAELAQREDVYAAVRHPGQHGHPPAAAVDPRALPPAGPLNRSPSRWSVLRTVRPAAPTASSVVGHGSRAGRGPGAPRPRPCTPGPTPHVGRRAGRPVVRGRRLLQDEYVGVEGRYRLPPGRRAAPTLSTPMWTLNEATRSRVGPLPWHCLPGDPGRLGTGLSGSEGVGRGRLAFCLGELGSRNIDRMSHLAEKQKHA